MAEDVMLKKMMQLLSIDDGSVEELAVSNFQENSKKLKSKNEASLIQCALCPNMCEFACPVLTADGREAVSPQKKARLGFLFERGLVGAEETDHISYYCLSCDACKTNCPLDLSVCEILRPVREKLKKAEAVPPAAVGVERNLSRYGSVYGSRAEVEKGKASIPLLTGDTKPGPDAVLIFLGCVTRHEHPGIVDALEKITRHLGEEVYLLEEEICCGGPALELGFTELFKEIAGKNSDIINDSGISRILCGCPTCTYTFREHYAASGAELTPEVLHTSEYLAGNMDKLGSMALSETTRVVYHDSCTLARKLGIIEEPRSVIKGIGNGEMEEPFYSRENTSCCGRGGTLKYADKPLCGEIARERTDHLLEYGDSIITACPSCKYSLNGTGEGVRVLDITELVAEGLNGLEE